MQTAKDGLDFNRFVREFEDLIVGKSVSVLSIDGDSLNPTVEEYNRGWRYGRDEVAYFDHINTQELKTEIFANCYDEWYLFDTPTEMKTNHIFVTYSGFRLINIGEDTSIQSTVNKFWNDIERNNPASFIIYGDNFIYGTKKKCETQRIATAWKQKMNINLR